MIFACKTPGADLQPSIQQTPVLAIKQTPIVVRIQPFRLANWEEVRTFLHEGRSTHFMSTSSTSMQLPSMSFA
jgi:hypothetical protein